MVITDRDLPRKDLGEYEPHMLALFRELGSSENLKTLNLVAARIKITKLYERSLGILRWLYQHMRLEFQ